MKNKFIILAILSIGFTQYSCDKKKDEDPQPVTSQQMTLRFTPVIGTDTLKYNTSFTNESGVRYTVSSYRYYVSNIKLVKSDNSEVDVVIPTKAFLISPNVSDYSLGNVPLGEYKSVKFTLGLDSDINHADPTVYPNTHPLAIQSPGIHWSWNSGYIFKMIEGSCDTTVNNDDVLTYGSYSHNMFFHIGMDALKRQIEVSNTNFTVASNSPLVLNIHSDINKLFTGVDLKTENASHTMGSMTLATKVADNFNSMFKIVK